MKAAHGRGSSSVLASLPEARRRRRLPLGYCEPRVQEDRLLDDQVVEALEAERPQMFESKHRAATSSSDVEQRVFEP